MIYRPRPSDRACRNRKFIELNSSRLFLLVFFFFFFRPLSFSRRFSRRHGASKFYVLRGRFRRAGFKSENRQTRSGCARERGESAIPLLHRRDRGTLSIRRNLISTGRWPLMEKQFNPIDPMRNRHRGREKSARRLNDRRVCTQSFSTPAFSRVVQDYPIRPFVSTFFSFSYSSPCPRSPCLCTRGNDSVRSTKSQKLIRMSDYARYTQIWIRWVVSLGLHNTRYSDLTRRVKILSWGEFRVTAINRDSDRLAAIGESWLSRVKCTFVVWGRQFLSWNLRRTFVWVIEKMAAFLSILRAWIPSTLNFVKKLALRNLCHPNLDKTH